MGEGLFGFVLLPALEESDRPESQNACGGCPRRNGQRAADIVGSYAIDMMHRERQDASVVTFTKGVASAKCEATEQ
jgi:hypothetical protein